MQRNHIHVMGFDNNNLARGQPGVIINPTYLTF